MEVRSTSFIINAIEFRVPTLKDKCINITLLGDRMVSVREGSVGRVGCVPVGWGGGVGLWEIVD